MRKKLQDIIFAIISLFRVIYVAILGSANQKFEFQEFFSLLLKCVGSVKVFLKATLKPDVRFPFWQTIAFKFIAIRDNNFD